MQTKYSEAWNILFTLFYRVSREILKFSKYTCEIIIVNIIADTLIDP